jgi:hypothetical protein
MDRSGGGGVKTLCSQPSQTTFANSVENQRYGSLLLRLAGAKVTDHMVHINEELEAAKAAKAAISALSTATPKSAVLATLNKANNAAILNLSSGGALNEARAKVGIALSNLIHGPPTPLSIDRAKSAIEAWIRELEASPAA